MPDKDRKSTVFASTALTLSLAFGQVAAAAGPAPPAKPPEKDTLMELVESREAARDAPTYKAPVLPAKVAQRNDKMRIALLNQAQVDFGKINLSSAYGRELQLLQDQTNTFLRGDNATVHYKMAFIDPVRYDAGTALNIGPVRTVETILDGQNLWPDPDKLFDVAKTMRQGSYNTAFSNGRREYPSAFVNNYEMRAEACVVVPSSDIAPLEINGMPYNAAVDYVNRHESFHCRDDKYTLRDYDPLMVALVKPDMPERMAGDAVLQDIFLVMHKREVFADVAAAAEMIRNGNDPKTIIGPVKDWRTKEGGTDISHYTVPALDALSKVVDGMGVQNFREMDQTALRKLCYRLTEENAIKPRELDTMFRYRAGTDADKAALQAAAKGDPEIRRALGIEGKIAAQLAKKSPGWASLTPEQQKTDAQLRAWPASQLLQDRAFRLEGKITPLSMVKAYAQIHDELRLERQFDPDSALPAAKMSKLQQTLQREVRIMDYAYLNQQRGVKIEDVEPSLAAFRTTNPKTATAPAKTPARPPT